MVSAYVHQVAGSLANGSVQLACHVWGLQNSLVQSC